MKIKINKISKMNLINGPNYYNQIQFHDKFIHNFGERHDIATCDESSFPFVELLQRTFEMGEAIDFYIELNSPIKHTMYDLINTSSVTVNSILQKFKACFTLNKERNQRYYRSDECFYSNIRFHMIDIRSQLYIMLNQDFRQTLIEIVLSYHHQKTSPATELLEKLIQNQFKDIEDHRIKHELEKLFQETIHRIRNIKFTIPLPTEIDKETFYTYRYELNRKIKNIFFDLTSPFVDIFLLARLFRSFKTKEESKNCILYTGMNHSIRITRFFEKIGAKVSPTMNLNCVGIIGDSLTFQFNWEWVYLALYQDPMYATQLKGNVYEDYLLINNIFWHNPTPWFSQKILTWMENTYPVKSFSNFVTEINETINTFQNLLQFNTTKQVSYWLSLYNSILKKNVTTVTQFQEEMGDMIKKLKRMKTHFKSGLSYGINNNLILDKNKVLASDYLNNLLEIILEMNPYQPILIKEEEKYDNVDSFLYLEEFKIKPLIVDIEYEMQQQFTILTHITLPKYYIKNIKQIRMYHDEIFAIYKILIDINEESLDEDGVNETEMKTKLITYYDNQPPQSIWMVLDKIKPTLIEFYKQIQQYKEEDIFYDFEEILEKMLLECTESYHLLKKLIGEEQMKEEIKNRYQLMSQPITQLIPQLNKFSRPSRRVGDDSETSLFSFLQDIKYFENWEIVDSIDMTKLITRTIHKISFLMNELLPSSHILMYHIVHRMFILVQQIESTPKPTDEELFNELIRIENALQYTWEQQMKLNTLGKKRKSTRKQSKRKSMRKQSKRNQ